MSGEEIASGYLSIGPALVKDFKSKLDAQLQPVAADVGKSFGQATATAMPAGVTASTAVVKRAGQDIGRTVVDGMATTVRTTAAPLIQNALAGTSGVLSSLKKDLTGLAGKTTSLAVVRNAASGLVGSLGGISSILQYGGPLGIALAAGGLALGAYAQHEADAQAAVDAFTGALDKQTGRVTANNAVLAAQAISDALGPEKIQTLKSMGITLADITTAFLAGGTAQDAMIAKLREIERTGVKTVKDVRGATVEAYTAQGAAAHQLLGVLDDQNSTLNASKAQWQAHKDVQDAADSAARRLGISIDGTTKALDGTAGAGAIARQALDGIASAAKVVTDRIAAVPKDVTVTARTAGLDALIAKLDAIVLRYAQIFAQNTQLATIATDGERHGADVGSTNANNRTASQAAAAADAAVAAAKAAVSAHNTAAATKQAAEATAAANKKAAAEAKAATAAAKAAAAAQKQAQEILDKRTAINTNIRNVVTQARNGVIPDVVSVPHTGPGLARYLAKQLDTLKRFRTNLSILAKRGLPTVFLQQLIAAGLDGAQAAASLVAANDADFSSIRSLTTQLQTQAGALGADSVKILYGTGVSAAKGLIAGLDSQQKAIEAQVVKIAKGMESAIKKALGIRSPSTVFRALGFNVARGTELGILDGAPGTQRAALSLVRPPSAVGVQAGALGAAARAAGPLIGELNVHNPVAEPASASVTHSLRGVAFLAGATA